ncbi:TonB-dependent receptor [Sphingomonas immobilis]|uniref:TonB-dependent receptor n=1 Tax=Sphingomonas immobilis TaxID=3063997 RepID=A0ABT8ZYF1_9SPHN|nr:TonB-dependent receptor [Sphingomonas sp. CA1-15]MDO7842313.1 TonB-dependent receptor [Sphingomonas sp. CA1-15]
MGLHIASARRVAIAAVLLAGSSTQAFAQTTAQPETAPAPAAQPDVGDIVVTAQRREERLQDVPISISAFSAATLQNSGIQSSKELAQVVPGFNFAQSSFSPQPTIRGIGTRGVGAGDESVVPVYIDGVYQPFLASSVMELNNIDRIEVLRGPQGALLGRNSTGGAINIITTTPSAQEAFKASASYGNYDEVLLKGYATGGNDVIAADLAVLYKDDNGYLKNLQGGPNRGDTNGFSIRGKVRVRPTENLDLIFSVSHNTMRDSLATSAQPLNRNTTALVRNPAVLIPTGPFETSTNGGDSRFQQNAGSLTAIFHAGFADITAITGVDRSQLDILSDNDATAQPVSLQKVNYYSNSIVQELYASSTTGRLDWIVGGTYFQATAGNNPSQVITTSAAGVTTAATNIVSVVTTDSIAAYAQLTYHLTDALSITAAGRYTSEIRGFDITNLNLTTNNERFGRKRFSQFTPSGTIQYKFSDDANVYLKAGQGFKSGIFASSTFPSGSANPVPVNPETVTQYEIGGKFKMAPWLRGTIAAFYTDYSDLQVNVRNPVTLASDLQNAGAARLYGGEAELFANPVQGLNLRFGMSLLHGTYTSYPGAQVTTPILSAGGVPTGGNATVFIDATGKNIIRTPFITVSGGFDYAFDIGAGKITTAANVYYSGKQYWEASNRVVQPGYTLINGEVGWRPAGGHYKVAVWVQNLLDTAHQLYILSSASGDTQVFAKPRTYGVRVGVDF